MSLWVPLLAFQPWQVWPYTCNVNNMKNNNDDGDDDDDDDDDDDNRFMQFMILFE